MAVKFEYDNQKVLILNVYMPYDDRSHGENYECFLSHLGLIHSLIQDSDTSCAFVIGDWNANISNNSIFGNELLSFCSDFNYVLSDVNILGQTDNNFTFYSESHSTTSWLDHCLSTVQGHNTISSVNILHDFHTSDHFPISVALNIDNLPYFDPEVTKTKGKCKWYLADEDSLKSYYTDSNELLSKIVLPNSLLHCNNMNCDSLQHKHDINSLFNEIVSCLSHAAVCNISHSSVDNVKFNVPGWNDIVKDAHSEARLAFKLWANASKPRQGSIFRNMQLSRANFKYALRCCRNNERKIKADALASDLLNKDIVQFWKHVDMQSSNKLPLANTVGGATGHNNIASMWCSHFKDLFTNVKSETDKDYALNGVSDIKKMYYFV